MGRLAVLLHGLGATGAVWHGVAARLTARGWRWIAPDLRGHGAGPQGGPFGYGTHAADVAALIADEDPAQVTVLGHSFGGVVGAVLAGGLFGPPPARLVALGIKTDWTGAEVEGARALAAKPRAIFATRDEAQTRYLRVSGLAGLVHPDDPQAQGGIRATPQGWTLAMDPRACGAVGPDIPRLLASVACPLRLAAGGDDPMASPATLRRLDPGAVILPGLPHNAHVADPAAVAALLDPAQS